MNAKRLFVAMLILAVALATTACGLMSVSTEDGELTINVNLSENQVNSLIGGVFRRNDGDDFLFEDISSVDIMEPNIIRAFGSTADGATGSYDLTIDVVDGALKLEVVAVDVPGVTLDDPRVQAANEELAQAFLDNTSSSDGDGVTEAAVVDDELILTIKAQLNE